MIFRFCYRFLHGFYNVRRSWLIRISCPKLMISAPSRTFSAPFGQGTQKIVSVIVSTHLIAGIPFLHLLFKLRDNTITVMDCFMNCKAILKKIDM